MLPVRGLSKPLVILIDHLFGGRQGARSRVALIIRGTQWEVAQHMMQTVAATQHLVRHHVLVPCPTACPWKERIPNLDLVLAVVLVNSLIMEETHP